MDDQDEREPIERLRGLGEAIDRAVSEARLRRVQIQEQSHADEVRALRRLLQQQEQRHGHAK